LVAGGGIAYFGLYLPLLTGQLVTGSPICFWANALVRRCIVERTVSTSLRSSVPPRSLSCFETA
jgi:hypothetical protein